MANDSLAGYYVTYGDYDNRPHRHTCKICGTYLTLERRMQRVWGGRKISSKQPYCPKCKKFRNWSTMSMENAVFKPYG